MGRRIHVLLLLVLASCATSVAQPAPFGLYESSEFSPDFTLLEFNQDLIRFELEWTRLQETGTIDLFQPQPGTWGDMNLGGHLMPRLTFYIALPATGNPTLSIENLLMVDRPATPRSVPENSGAIAQLGDVGVFAGVRLVPVTIKPFSYVNNSNEVSIVSQATIRIDLDDQPGENPVTSVRPAYSAVTRRVMQSVVANWQSIPNILAEEPSHHLLIVPDNYLSQLENYVTWKRQMGAHVTVVPKSQVDDATGNLIKARIEDGLSESPRVDYVTLVGDETMLPVHYQATNDPVSRFSDATYPGSFTNEGFYTEHEGNDVFPDVFLGRWPVSSTTEARTIANRTVQHERDSFIADSLRFEHSAVAADFTEDTQRMTKQRARQQMLAAGITEVDTLWGETNPGHQNLLNWLSEGLTFVNYRGSGWQQGWAGISFYYWNVPDISNPGKLPIVTGIGCGVGKFDAPDNQCFGEAWMTHGSVATPQGSAGFIGPCWNTHTVYNDCLDTCLYRAMLDYQIGHLMPSFAAAKMYAWAVFADFLDESAVEELCRVMFRQYLALSDPSLQVFTDTPARIPVAVQTAISSGEFNVPITVTEGPGTDVGSLNVTFSSLAGAFYSGTIPAAPGQYFVPVNFEVGDEVTATITGRNILTRQFPITVDPTGPYLTHHNLSFSDAAGNGDGRVQPGEQIQLIDTVYNIGSDVAFSAAGALSTEQPRITITNAVAQYDAVNAGQLAASTTPYTFSVDQDVLPSANVALDITYTAENMPARSDQLFLTLYMPTLETGQVTLNDIDGDGMLERNEAADFVLTMSNTGNDTLVPSDLLVVTESPYLLVLDETVELPQLAPGQSYSIPSGAIRLAGAWNAPSGITASGTAVITAQMETYVFQKVVHFEFVLGQVGPQDPQFGADGQYYIYDNTDTEYERAAVYDWVEISPALGGPGTALGFTQSQQTFNVPVPFNYSYFGTSFNTLSISTDGWVAPGATDETSYQNMPLPNAIDFVSGMIGVLWNDLWYFFGDEGDVSYYYDTTGDRFIVEWREITDWGSGTRPNTFQLQLLNPASHPTPTNDAEWVFLYQDLTYHSTAAAGATIGYESMDELLGDTYYFDQTAPPTSAPLQDGRALRLTTYPPTLLAADDERPELPTGFALHQNYPNPFNPETAIEFSLPQRADVRLEVFDILGRSVTSLVSGYYEAGTHRVLWNGKSGAGITASSGIYFCRMTAPGFVETRRMLLMR